MKIGMQELIIILIVVIIIFGPTQIPKLTKMFGKSVKSFKDGMEEADAGEVSADDKPQKSQKAKAGKNAGAADEEES